jgi:uncharacterized protein with HEPN domain
MRREALYLADILEAADAVSRFVKDVEREDFFADEMRQSAVLQKLIIIGEAAARLPIDFRERHSEVEWVDIVGFRNIAVHEYFAISWSIVWITAVEDVPRMQRKIARILAEEYPEM